MVKPFNFSASDLLLCANPNVINCTENFDYENCGQLNQTDFENYSCKFLSGFETDYFESPNRMDKKEALFQRPPIVVKNTRKSVNYNTELLFDDFYIYCGNFNFTYEDFYQVTRDHGMEFCDLTDGARVRIGDLWTILQTDFSFNMTKKMNEL